MSPLDSLPPDEPLAVDDRDPLDVLVADLLAAPAQVGVEIKGLTYDPKADTFMWTHVSSQGEAVSAASRYSFLQAIAEHEALTRDPLHLMYLRLGASLRADPTLGQAFLDAAKGVTIHDVTTGTITSAKGA